MYGFSLVFPNNRGEIRDLLEGIDDTSKLLTVVHTHLYTPLEDTLVGGYGELMDVDVHLVGNDESHVTGNTLAVDTLDDNDSIEEQVLVVIVHIPAHGKDAVRIGVAKTIDHLT